MTHPKDMTPEQKDEHEARLDHAMLEACRGNYGPYITLLDERLRQAWEDACPIREQDR